MRVCPTLRAGENRTGGDRPPGTDVDTVESLQVISMAHGQGNAEIWIDRGPTLTCNHEAPIVAHALRGEGFDASEDGTGRGTPLVSVISESGDIASTLRTGGNDHADIYNIAAVAIRTAQTSANGHGISEGLAHTLDQAQGQAVAMGLSWQKSSMSTLVDMSTTLDMSTKVGVAYGIDEEQNAQEELMGTLKARTAGGGFEGAVAYSTKLHNTTSNQAGKVYEEYCTSLDRSSPPPAVFQPTACEAADTLSVGANQTTGFKSDIASFGMQVRRLTPRECERLQGFPDDYTAIPWRGKAADQCPDGPRYKSLGNSWAVPVVRWIGQRINLHLEKQ